MLGLFISDKLNVFSCFDLNLWYSFESFVFTKRFKDMIMLRCSFSDVRGIIVVNMNICGKNKADYFLSVSWWDYLKVSRLCVTRETWLHELIWFTINKLIFSSVSSMGWNRAMCLINVEIYSYVIGLGRHQPCTGRLIRVLSGQITRISDWTIKEKNTRFFRGETQIQNSFIRGEIFKVVLRQQYPLFYYIKNAPERWMCVCERK